MKDSPTPIPVWSAYREAPGGLAERHLTFLIWVALGGDLIWAGVDAFMPEMRHLLPYHGAVLLFGLFCIGLVRRGHPRAAAAFFSVAVWILVQLPPFVQRDLAVPGVLLPPLSILLAGLIWSGQAAMALAFLSSVVWAAALWATHMGWLGPPRPPRSDFVFWLLLTEALFMTSIFLHLALQTLRNALAEARGTHRQWRRLVAEAPDGILVLDSQGMLRMVNPAAERISGRRRTDLLGRRVWKVGALADPDAAVARAAFRELLAGRGGDGLEFDLVRPDGKVVPVEATGTVTRDASGEPFVEVILRDISTRRRLDERRTLLAERLQVAQKMEAVGQLAGGVAHDFNNLLTVMGGSAGLIEESPEASDSILELAGEIRAAQEQAAVLTRRLLAFAQRQIYEPKRVDLVTHVREQEPVLRGLGGETLHLTLDLRLSRAPVVVDPIQLEQVLVNLVSNARDATGAGGHVRVRLDSRTLYRELPGPAGVLGPGEYAVLAVEDDGAGIDADTLPRVFEPFFTTKDHGHGTGLGLSAVLGIVRQAGGQILISSQAGAGTRVAVFLPMEGAAAPTAPVG